MATVKLVSDFDPATVNVSNLEKNKRGGKVVYLSNSDTSRIMLQTPTMPAIFGFTPYEVGGDIQSYSIDLSFRGADTDLKVAEFRDKLKALDTLLIDTATEKSEEFFGKKMSRDMVAEFYRSLLNDKKPEYPPLVKLKVGVGLNGEPTAQFYNENREVTTIDHVTKGAMIKTIVELSSLWFVNKTFGATFRVIQVQVVSKPNRLQGFAFHDEDEEIMME